MNHRFRFQQWVWLLVLLLIAGGAYCVFLAVADSRARGIQEAKMTQIIRGVLSYEASIGHFPKISSADGSGLSWRVRILPFIGHEALYKRFRLDETWDSDHNRRLITEMPAVFETSSVRQPGHTSVHVFVENDSERPETVFTVSGVRLKSFVDGTANTIVTVVAGPARAEPWSKPSDLEVGRNPLSRKGNFEDTFCVASADGEVHTVAKSNLDDAMFRALLTHAGCEYANDLMLMRTGRTLIALYGSFDQLAERIEQDSRFTLRRSPMLVGSMRDLQNEQSSARRRTQSTKTRLFIVGGDEKGFEMMRFCQAAKEAGVPVICILEQNDEANIERIESTGATVLLMPVDPDDIMELVASMTSADAESNAIKSTEKIH